MLVKILLAEMRLMCFHNVYICVVIRLLDVGAADVCTPELRRAFNGVVMIQTDSGWGSGVLLDVNEGYILTCGHVVKHQPTGTSYMYVIHRLSRLF